jgi:hypothetical protein
MVRAFVESLLGEWGRAVLYFYDEHSLAINLVIVLYGMWVVFSWVNLKNIRKHLIIEIAEELRDRAILPGNSLSNKELKSLSIPWDRVVQKSNFPFVAPQNAFIPRRLSIARIQALLPVPDLVKDALALLKVDTKPQV